MLLHNIQKISFFKMVLETQVHCFAPKVLMSLLCKLPNWVGLSSSRKYIGPTIVSSTLYCQHLRVLCALICTNVEDDAKFLMSINGSKGNYCWHFWVMFLMDLGSLYEDNSMEGMNVFLVCCNQRGKRRKWMWFGWNVLFCHSCGLYRVILLVW